MTSGIYKLSFRDGSEYIGKSVDIERRWEEHQQSFLNGKAAKKLMDKYYQFGMPDMEIMYLVHKDHLDISEEFAIYAEKPELNTVLKDCPFTPNEIQFLLTHMKDEYELFWNSSTISHLRKIMELYDEIDRLEYELEYNKNENEETVEDLKSKLYDTEHGKHIKELEAQLRYQDKEIDRLREEIDDLHHSKNNLVQDLVDERNKPWWKKLFGL